MTTTDIRLPVDDEIAAALSEEGDFVVYRILEMWARDQRRTFFGMLRQAKRIRDALEADATWHAMIESELARKNEGNVRSLAFLEAQIETLAEQLLTEDSKHVDVPGAGRVQYRDYAAAIRIADPDAFIAALDADERARLVETVEKLKTNDAKKYQEEVLKTEGGTLLPGVEEVPARRTATIEYAS